MSGRLIAFEGGEGAGKTTQIRLLAEHLRMAGETVIVTREPGGTPGAEAIRDLFATGDAGRWTRETDALLVMAARADHVARLIRPALTRGATVLCDRFVHSTLAYQGHGHGVALDALRALHDFASGGLWPDRVLWLDLPVAVGLARARARGGADRFEANDLGFHQRVRDGFAALAAIDPRIIRIDADRPVDAIAAAVAAAVTDAC